MPPYLKGKYSATSNSVSNNNDYILKGKKIHTDKNAFSFEAPPSFVGKHSTIDTNTYDNPYVFSKKTVEQEKAVEK